MIGNFHVYEKNYTEIIQEISILDSKNHLNYQYEIKNTKLLLY